jgi:hypothetical protein
MNAFHDDRYLIFVRGDRSQNHAPDGFERYVISCPTYEEARRIQREYRSMARECVIRYLGPAGGGD